MDNERITVRAMEVIIKVTERCNINCTYCYYFNGGNEDFEGKPVYIDQDCVEGLARFLKNAVTEHGVQLLQLDLHGGEPLMMKKQRFADMLETFNRELGDIVTLRTALQTNGMLIDDEWIDIFLKYDVSVSVSLDGPEKENDIYRVDHKNQGTYRQTVAGLRMLQKARKERGLQRGGVICVPNPEFDGRAVYRHIVDDLNITDIHFSLPNNSRDGCPDNFPEGIRRFLLGALDEWLKDNDPAIDVRIFNRLLGDLVDFDFSRVPMPENALNYVAFTVRSDGQISGPDDLRNAVPGLFEFDLNVSKNTLADYLSTKTIRKLHKDTDSIPALCGDCGFKNVCRAGENFGSIANRYSFANGFDNRSIFCSAYQDMLLALCTFATNKGVKWETIERALLH